MHRIRNVDVLRRHPVSATRRVVVEFAAEAFDHAPNDAFRGKGLHPGSPPSDLVGDLTAVQFRVGPHFLARLDSVSRRRENTSNAIPANGLHTRAGDSALLTKALVPGTPLSELPIDDYIDSSRQVKLTNLLHIRHWKIGILVCFLIAMLITPADPVSMLVIAVPLSCVYLLAAYISARMR